MIENFYSAEKFENMGKDRIISLILKEHHKSIIIAAKKVKKKYKWIPLEFDDLYNVFISKIPNLIKKYDNTMNTKLSTYILNNAFYSMANYARRYSSSRFKTLNERIRIAGTRLRQVMKQEMAYQIINNLSIANHRIDFSNFNGLEKEIIRQYFGHNLSINKISQIHNFSYNKTTRLISQIKYKIKLCNKNIER